MRASRLAAHRAEIRNDDVHLIGFPVLPNKYSLEMMQRLCTIRMSAPCCWCRSVRGFNRDAAQDHSGDRRPVQLLVISNRRHTRTLNAGSEAVRKMRVELASQVRCRWR